MWRGLAAALLVACATSTACFDFGSLDTGPADGGADTGPCGSHQKTCADTCFDVGDPSVGCSGDCTACTAPANGQPACTLSGGVETCGLGTCNPQYGNCDESSGNGCETHTTTRANCGACGNDCLQEFCERQGDSYVCSASCDSPSQVCDAGSGGGECVDLTTDNGNCGGCGVSCAVSNGTGTCKDSQCMITCDPNYFSCGGSCILPNNRQCGASCGPCLSGTVCDSSPGSQTYGECIDAMGGGCQGDTCPTEAGPCAIPDQNPNCGTCGTSCGASLKCCQTSPGAQTYHCTLESITPDGGTGGIQCN